ncbi:VOC family protein [Paludisphaera sp.]|uniref:VOC family protein n=1 Tax=Paludisphaera sp. TaxID=2017432 RepID=UPI00301B8270
MAASVTSVFLYVKDVRRSLEFYNEVVGAEIVQVHAEQENAPYSLAILRLDSFVIMLHAQEAHAEEFADTRLGVGIHLQLQVDDVDAFYQNCLDQGAMLSVSGEPADQEWGWREFALRDPDGFVWSVYQDNTEGQWTG